MSAESNAGFTLGNLIAAVLSYAKWHSFWLAVGHCVCSWFYVGWYLSKYVHL